MGRPRLTEQRGDQILDAFIALVGANGLHATTLDDVATAVDLRRGTVRHFVGNREQLIVAAIDRLVVRYEQAFHAAVADGCTDGAIDRMLARLFVADGEMGLEDRAFVALMTAGDDPAIRHSIARAYERYLEVIDRVLVAGTSAGVEQRQDVALAILSLAETTNLLLELGFDHDVRHRALRTARALIQPLIGDG